MVTEDHVLIGIVTNRDLRFERDFNKRIDLVMTRENLITTSRSTFSPYNLSNPPNLVTFSPSHLLTF